MNLRESFFRSIQYFKYVIRATSAHALHSPFVFDLYTKVIADTTPFYAFEKVESLRAKMLLSREEILVEDFGTGNVNGRKKKLTLSYISSHFVKPKKYGQLLFRLINYLKPRNILELGTSLGITTLYLSLPDAQTKVITLEGSEETANMAALNFQIADAHNVKIITGEFSSTLSQAINNLNTLDFVYFDGNHRKAPTLNYFEQCLSRQHENSVFIFDDIYWSREMYDAWQEIKAHQAVTISIDLYSLGIVFFRKGIPKQHFTLRY